MAGIVLATDAAGCGQSGGRESAVSKSAAGATSLASAPARAAYRNGTVVRATKDRDDDDSQRLLNDDNNSAVSGYGHPATVNDRRAVTALLEHYYAIALKDDGAGACAMIEPGLVKVVPSDYGKLGPSYLHGGKTCAAVLTLLFKHEHRRLAAAVPKLAIGDVRVEGGGALVLLAFGAMPEREIQVRREGSTWRLGALLDGELP